MDRDPERGAELRFGLLGPLAAWRGDRPLALGSPQQQAVLAVLLLRRGQFVSADALVDALWPLGGPANALQTVRTYISRLRKVLADGSSSPLESGSAGYRLTADAEATDLERFEALAMAGRSALSEGKAAEAEESLTSALALARGQPLEGLEDLEAVRVEQERLIELRQLVEEDLVQARLDLGRHRELVSQLRAQVTENPERERSWAQLMLALYRSGRQVEALAAYREARDILVEEFGLEPGEDLRRLERMILLQEQTLDHDEVGRLHGVPRPATNLIGRDGDLPDLCELVGGQRLVSLVGPTGVGKTRLAIEAAVRLRPRFPDGIWWVDLSSVDAEGVLGAFAHALAVREEAGAVQAEGLLVARLRGVRVLVIVDSCEHVLEGVAPLLARIVAGTRGAHVLTTSQVPLRLGGEAVWPLRPLRAPAELAIKAGRLMDYEAAQLFMARSGGWLDRDRLDDAEASAVARIVVRLDGLPLAIELAAGRLRSLPLVELDQILERRLEVLDDGDRSAPVRHRTLETAIEWSYTLLSDDERRVLARLAVFPGSFDAAAASAVAADDATDSDSALGLLAQLVDKSLLSFDAGESRYRMLQTVRAFVRNRAGATSAFASAAERHRDHYTGLGEDLFRGLLEPGLASWLDLGYVEQENLHSALRWSLDHEDSDAALQLASALTVYWYRTSQLSEGLEFLRRALDLAPANSHWRPRALNGVLHLQLAGGSGEAPTTALSAITACEHADPELLGLSLAGLAQTQMLQGRFDEAEEAIERAHLIFAELVHPEGLHFTDELLGVARYLRGDLASALRYLLRSRDGYFEMRGSAQAGWTHIHLARVQFELGLLDDAETSARTGIEEFQSRHDPRGMAAAYTCLGRTHAARGDTERARLFLDEALELAHRWKYPIETAEAEVALGLLETA
jgi:predicted ATPase/DNA-binding SARP family transcriptional activator